MCNMLNNFGSFLSPPVQRLLVDSRQDHLTSFCDDSLVTSRLTFNWAGFPTYLNTSLDYADVDRYRTVCEQLWPIMIECGRKVEECEDMPVKFLEWTNCVKDIQLCFTQMQGSTHSTMPLKICLHLSSIFEHAVGNVYKLKEKNVPFLLRDLLDSTQLIGIFGNLPILVAKALLGTPLGFNLRNICWHGFPTPEEIGMNLAAALLVLITSFGELLDTADISSIPCRPKIGKNAWDSYLPAFQSMHFPQLKCYHSEITEMLESSDSIPKTHLSYWTLSLNFLCSESYGECLLLLLPALEHCLRCAYCSVNECPKRMLVAEQHVLYTTMDEILDQYYKTSESVKIENRLPSLLGNKLMDMLMDLLSSFGGPRIRDKLSHGECNLEEIPAVVANHVFCVSLSVLLKLGYTKKIGIMSSLTEVEEDYTAKFHSISLLKSEAITVIEKLAAFHVHFKPGLISSQVLDFQASVSSHILQFHNFPKNSNVRSLIEFCLKQPIVTLFRNSSDLALVSTLRKIIIALHQACKNCLAALRNRQNSLTQYTLRSRQRTSYFRMLEFMPSFHLIVECLVLVILVQLLILPQMISSLKFIKILQQYADNISSLSSLEKNRWVEMQEKTNCFCLQSIALFKKTPETNILSYVENIEVNISEGR